VAESARRNREQCRLAGPVRPKDEYDFALAGFDRHAVEHLVAVVTGDDAFEPQRNPNGRNSC
jgi:hypothetical protein